ncbi:FGGY-family carbohydrate kinase [Paenibacillus sp. GCM10027626]|uniref:xylulokinase n=1 Tax=Paenibacillus sp. GCM10027626 TaxID=3273411 RepID=UPI003626732D
MKYIAAFDIGSTNVKGVLVNEEAAIFFEKNVPIEIDYTGGLVEQDPETWYKAVVRIAEDWFRSGIKPQHIALISFSGQMQDCIAVGEDGAAVRPAILYSDGRGDEQAKRLRQELGEETITRETENHMDGTLTFPKILWMQEHEREHYNKTRSFLISSKDYVIAKLTGAFVTDPTSAATSGGMNIRSRTWMNGWFEQFGLDPTKLPAIIPSDQVAGVVHDKGQAESGFAAGTPVLCGIGDAGSATLGAGVYRDGEIYAYIGTTGWVAAASGGFMDVQNGAFNLSYVEADRQIAIAPLTNAGNAHKWAVEVFGPAAAGQLSPSIAFKEFEQALDKVVRGSSDSVLFLPYLNGERCPIQDLNASGCFIGLTATTTRARMGAAVLEGVAMAIRQVMELIVEPGTELRVTLIGGGAKSAAWCRIIADVLQCELVVPEDSQFLPSIGAAILGFSTLGWGSDYAALCAKLKAAQKVESFKPDASLAEYYDKQFQKYKQLYPLLAPMFAMN